MKIVVNRDFGGFELTKAVFNELGIEWTGYGYLRNESFNIKSDNHMAYRADSKLIAAIEKVGIKESGDHGELKIIEIPDNTEWEISDYDGAETIHELHQSW